MNAVWASVIGSVLVLAGVVYNARRAAKSSDRAQQVALQAQANEAAAAASAAENSGYTRAQEMIERAAKTQQEAFDKALARMEQQMADMQAQLDRQARQLAEAADQIRSLQRSREQDRREYRRYIEKLLDLLHTNKIDYPTPPPFFDGDNTPPNGIPKVKP